MLRSVLEGLQAAGVLDAWRTVEQQVESRELFLVGARADMRRAKQVSRLSATVYRDFTRDGQASRGSATVRLHPTQSRRELERALRAAAGAAAHVQNPAYPLVAPGGPVPQVPEASGVPDLGAALDSLGAALLETGGQHRAEEARLNSAELFLERGEIRVRNSQGVDVRLASCSFSAEIPASTRAIELSTPEGLSAGISGCGALRSSCRLASTPRAIIAREAGE